MLVSVGLGSFFGSSVGIAFGGNAAVSRFSLAGEDNLTGRLGDDNVLTVSLTSVDCRVEGR